MKAFFLVLSFFVSYPVHAGVICNPIPENAPNEIQHATKSTVTVRTVIISTEGIKTTRTIIPGGSGFIVNTTGRIATNFHVLEDYYYLEDTATTRTVYEVILSNCTAYTARPVFTQEDVHNMPDIAFLDIINPPENLVPVVFEKIPPKEGDIVYAIGSPGQKINTIVQGVVLPKKESLHMIRASTYVNYGGSGGILVNQQGKVLGMTRMCSLANASNNEGTVTGCSGNGFFIPSNTIVEWLDFFEWIEDFREKNK